MPRPTNKHRLGTLIVTAVPVAALGVATGAGAGAPLAVFAPAAVLLGVVVGALLASALAPVAEPVEPRAHRTFGVRALLARAAHEARPALAEVDVRVDVRVDVTPAPLRTVGDPECLHRALAELIAQAARRSPPGGIVTLAARSAPSGVRLEVVDEGPGDCGAGLAAARRIVDCHGGELRAEAALPRGCRVVLELPGA
jgi:hypothetical protein